jgi:hypothetical protein
MSASFMPLLRVIVYLALAASALSARAGVLPEDRGDILWHQYDGGGVTVDGPSILVRKKIGESIDVNFTGDLDMVSSASIDVMSAASPYKEKRKQWSPGVSYLRGKTTYGVSFLRSDEPDYLSDNASFSISEDMFGDLTTVTLGFTRGWDDVKQHLVDKSHGTDSFLEKGRMDRRNYRIGLTQILTKKLIATLNYESSAQDGYLQNPYRRVRYGAANSTSISYQSEIYPGTRSSNAVGIDASYYLPYRASVKLGYRYYTDTWGITAHTGDLQYLHPFGSRWTAEFGVRYYTQTHADFYSDLFPYIDAQNFMARDRVLATYNDVAVHLGAEWKGPFGSSLKGRASIFYDRIQYSYADFRNNLNTKLTPAQQPLYSYGANVFQIQYSFQY